MSSRKRTDFRKKLNPAFAAAHGLAAQDSNDVSVSVAAAPKAGATAQNGTATNEVFGAGAGCAVTIAIPAEKASFSQHRLEQILKQARASGKLNASNAGLSHPLPDNLFDLRVPVDLSIQSSSTSSPYSYYTEEVLTAVDFSDNEIESIDERVLKYIQSQSFRFRRSGLSKMTIDLTTLDQLRILDLSGNKLESLDFSLLPSGLIELYLQSNDLQKIEAKSFEGVTSFPLLTTLDLSENKLSSLEDYPGKILVPKLETLRCSKNRLTSLPGSLLESCQSSLQMLDMSNNQIASQERLDFSNFVKLHTISFGFNKLELIPCIPPHATQRLDMNTNKLKSIDGLFPINNKSTSVLVTLLLQDNYIEELSADVVEKFTQLQRLDLAYNKLKTLPYQLGFLPQIQTMQLLGNPLLTFKSSDMENPRAIMQVLRNRAPKSETNNTKASSMLSSGIRHRHNLNFASRTTSNSSLDLDALANDLVKSSQQAFEISGQLVLDGNRLTSIPAELFQSLPNVTEISISDNFMTELPTSLASNCGQLARLYMARNRISSLDNLLTISPITWSGSLLRLDLSVNRLTEFPMSLMKKFVNLETLNLSANRFQSVSDWTWLPESLSVLDLSDNQIEEMEPLVFLLGSHCPRLQSLSLASNNIRKIPYSIGLLLNETNNNNTALRYLDLKGNPQQAIRHEILQKSCIEQLQYFYSRMTPEQKEEARSRFTNLAGSEKSYINPAKSDDKENFTLSAQTQSKSNGISMQTKTSMSNSVQSRTTVGSMNDSNGRTESNKTEPTKQPAPSETLVVNSEVSKEPAKIEESNEVDLIDEYKRQIQEFEVQLDSPSLTQAKRYAIKKSLAMTRSKLIREERRLGLRK